MSEDNRESMATVALREAMVVREQILDELEQEFPVELGRRIVTVRQVRRATREAADGDVAAISKLMFWARVNGHQDGEMIPCPVCRAINELMPTLETQPAVEGL